MSSNSNTNMGTGGGVTMTQFNALVTRVSNLEADLAQIKEVLDKFISNY